MMQRVIKNQLDLHLVCTILEDRECLVQEPVPPASTFPKTWGLSVAVFVIVA